MESTHAGKAWLAKLKHRGYENELVSGPAFLKQFKWQKVLCSPLENISASLVLIKPPLLLLNLNYHIQHKMLWAQYWLPQEPREKAVLIFCTVVILSLIWCLYLSLIWCCQGVIRIEKKTTESAHLIHFKSLKQLSQNTEISFFSFTWSTTNIMQQEDYTGQPVEFKTVA